MRPHAHFFARNLFISSVLAAMAAIAPAAAQTPTFDRGVREIAIGDADSTGQRPVTALVDLHAANSSVPLDLSFALDLQLLRQGTAVHTVSATFVVQTDGGVGGCESSCGGSCGGLYVNGVLNTMTCHVDGPLPGGGVDCDCGYWLTADMGPVPAQPGDEIVVQLRPLSGALVDADQTNDEHRRVFDGSSVGWGRDLRDVSVVASPTGGVQIRALVDLHVAGASTAMDLSTDLEVLVNGQSQTVHTWSISNDPTSGGGGSCDVGCGGGCGGLYVDGVLNTMTCHLDGVAPGGFVDCDCGTWLSADLGPFLPEPGSDILVLSSDTSGAVPDVPTGSVQHQWVETVDLAARPNVDRWVRSIAVAPSSSGPAGRYLVTPVLGLEVDGVRSVLDLSTEVELLINGATAGTIVIDGATLGPSFGCVGSCGSNCGPLYIDGAFNTLLCRFDGPLPGGGVDCDCGYWLAPAFPPVPLTPGDEVTVLLRPAPGGIPEQDTADDQMQQTFDGTDVGWNRGVRNVQWQADAAGGSDLSANVYASVSDPTVAHDLSFDAQVLINGVIVASQSVGLLAVPTSATDLCDVACDGGSCADFQSPSGHNWITAACAVLPGLGGCNCGSTLDLQFVGLPPIVPGDQVMVQLVPTPQALPELPGFDGDDAARPEQSTATPGLNPRRVRLSPNRPNPFNPATTIAFELPRAGRATLEVYDARGTRVRTLVTGELSEGEHVVTWRGRDDEGRAVASGTYYFRLVTDEESITRKGMLLK